MMRRIRLFLFFGLLPATLQAQLCTGSLGDPVVNITFGTGFNPGNPTTPPGYNYTTSSCPNDGFYTITASTAGCFGDSWHTVTNDHTGNGNFMLVNASFQPADFFVTTLNNLCPNTTYEFSAWIMNVLKSPTGIKPNLTFRIETPGGTVLSTFNTGDILVSPQPEWRQYGFFFTTIAGNPDIVLRITNNAPGGNGNDLALDDITFRPCGPELSTSILGNNDIVDICDYNQVGYTMSGVISAGFLNPVFQWQSSPDSGRSWTDIPGAVSLSYLRQPTTWGNFWYRLTVAEAGNGGIPSCRIASNVLEINVRPRPLVSAGPDRVLIAGRTTQLNGQASGEGVSVAWTPATALNDPASVTTTANPASSTLYTLTATSVYGCVNSDEALVNVVAGIFVPTAFTPNNDGRNDTWRIPNLDPSLNAGVIVYNRWGQTVYRAAGVAVNWNGNFEGLPQPAGTYVWVMNFTDGTPPQKGTLTLIR